jgi:iron complex outermembrane receptor protein
MAEGDRAGERAKRWRFLMTTCLAGALLGLPAAARAQIAAPTQMAAFAIPAQPLARALDAFSRASGWEVGYPSPIVRGRTSRAVSGTMKPAEALQALLAGTGIGLRLTGPSTVALVAPPVETVGAIEEPSVLLDTLSVEGRGGDGVQGLVARSSSFGTKTSTPLIETPQTINVVTRSQIEIQQPQDLMQALRYSAGVNAEFYGPAHAGSDDAIAARGFVLTRYLDGLRTGSLTGTGATVDPYLIERIDVLKGPASTLYGTSPPGGLVNITSKRPTDMPLREVLFQTGSYGRARAGVDLGGPIDDEGRFLYRLTGVGHTAGTQFGLGTKDRVTAFAPAFTWRPDADTSLTVLGRYQYNPSYIRYQFLPALGTVLPNPNGRIPYRLYGGDPSFDRAWVQQASVGYEFDHRFESNWRLRQNLRVQEDRSQERIIYPFGFNSADPTLRTLNRNVFRNIWHSNSLQADTQLEGIFDTGILHHDVLMGVDYQRATRAGKFGIGTASPIDAYVPVRLGYTYPYIHTGLRQDFWQAGLYAQDQIKLGQFLLTLGGSYDWTVGETTDRFVSPRTTTRQADSAFSGRVGLTYLWDIGLAPYISYATSFEPVPGADYASKPFRPSTGEQYEAGIKYQPPGLNAFLQASVFDITQQNVKTDDPLHIGFQIQTGEVRSRGVELEARASLAEGLDVILAYAHLDAKVTKSTGDDLGKQLPIAPADPASAFLTYRFQGGVLAGLTLGGGLRYSGTRYGTSSNLWEPGAGPYTGTRSRLPDYTLVDAVLSYDFGVRYPDLAGLQLQVNASNLLGTKYVASCGYVYSCYYGYERTVYATLRYRF